MEKIKIVLPTVYDAREWKQPYSAASMYLGAACDARPRLREAVEFELMSFESTVDGDELATAIAAANPDIVGFGIYTWNEKPVNKAIDALRGLAPNAKCFLGGLSVLYADHNFALHYPTVELFFRGDCEDNFPIVLEHLLDGDYEQIVRGDILIPGVSSHSNYAQRVPDRAVVSLPEIPSYYLPDASGSSFFERHANEHWETVWWETCRGCVYSCAFCGFDAQELGFRHHDVEKVLAEFDQFIAHGVKNVFLTDAILGGKRNNAKEILRGLSHPSRVGHDMYLYAFLRPEMIDDEFARLLAAARFGFVNIGLQTVNPDVPQEMRSNNLDLVRENLPRLTQYGVNYQTDLIAGFPGETYAGFLESVKFVIEHARPTRFRVYHLSVLPGTSLYSIVQHKESGWLTFDEDGAVTSSYSWEKPELDKMLRFANFSVSLYNYLQQRDWLSAEEEYRDIEFFKAVFAHTERYFSDVMTAIIEWDQKGASLNLSASCDEELEMLLTDYGLAESTLAFGNQRYATTGGIRIEGPVHDG